MIVLGFALLGYLLGSIPFGLILTRTAGLGDIRKVGSGNIGATNVLRTGHKGLAALTLLLDALKGVLAVLLTHNEGRWIAVVAGLFAVIGHLYPVWLGFKGGKGVAVGLGVLLAEAFPVGLIACAVWLAVAFWKRMSSLAALTAFATAPIIALLFGDWRVAIFAVPIAILVFHKHHANIERLRAGTEPRIKLGS
ncbi:glycerol-3-phosphate 1-O-acyltransferase PlsY [Acidiphilium sp. AL]|uniref:Glycerol-3-phosphate acyltransferase n=1 Tax=Acidiphilium iwatense TaxID=768198 RepID=A0ABS9DZV2_9PROT|nr:MULTISPECIES: glycerol-3-phosphate 1-O-acyltransferase PlsY [Acidiphilium]MCF3948287.1 glycerol-3-phosphate 1-O-acyltransferase PlsY [Acidiphilium iwatense]MCU4161252.1 glycerol-3-phosphate 1-O-acyltransferase PlsY [Acidiphilium sp. AL]